jgi:hypothetical protein
MVKIDQMPVPVDPPNPSGEQVEEVPRGIVHEYPPRAPLRRPLNGHWIGPVRDATVRWQRVNNFFINQIAESYEPIQTELTSEEQMFLHDALRTVSNRIAEMTQAVRIRREAQPEQ